MLLAHNDGNFNLGLIVTCLILALLKLYDPAPGLLFWLKIEMDLQSYLLCPIVRPFLGDFSKSDAKVYLSGDGEFLLLYKWRNTE